MGGYLGYCTFLGNWSLGFIINFGEGNPWFKLNFSRCTLHKCVMNKGLRKCYNSSVVVFVKKT